MYFLLKMGIFQCHVSELRGLPFQTADRSVFEWGSLTGVTGPKWLHHIHCETNLVTSRWAFASTSCPSLVGKEAVCTCKGTLASPIEHVPKCKERSHSPPYPNTVRCVALSMCASASAWQAVLTFYGDSDIAVSPTWPAELLSQDHRFFNSNSAGRSTVLPIFQEVCFTFSILPVLVKISKNAGWLILVGVEMVIPFFSITSDQWFFVCALKSNEISGFHVIPIHILFALKQHHHVLSPCFQQPKDWKKKHDQTWSVKFFDLMK